MPSNYAGLYIGLMSGTSVDGIDAALIEISDSGIELVKTLTGEYSSKCQTAIKSLMLEGAGRELETLMWLDVELGSAFANAALTLIDEAGVEPSSIKAIGSHGQTIRHYPSQIHSAIGSTLQIGDPNIINQRTQIPVIADLRRADIALGGQGAPLMPAFHQAMFEKSGTSRAIVNIGGIANITILNNLNITGFDTGPGNTLMDAWHAKHKGTQFDKDGVWASTGKVDIPLLNQLLADPWFAKQPPKSTGQDYFNLEWLKTNCPDNNGIEHLQAEDVQATLLELTAKSIARCVVQSNVDETYICGGGANNPTLMRALAQQVEAKITSTNSLGLDPNWVEAAGFGWLAWCHLNHKPANVPAVTGASNTCVLGARWG
ncbi:MAG: anhydro-N-acetylmuramic acid kinase [Proteobacteria bacterium]|jgi:anhydro-N-acetylmuramic acid kinase|nr:anhydro-N-acetylmuramic acid kinase [Pseudomonadota bacterium]